MSGFVGILRVDGVPVEPGTLQGLTNFQAIRGPDAQQVWLDGCVGFGHTLLKTTEESHRERQPLSLDGNAWIVADARVDGRRELIVQLRAHGHEDLAADAPDAELLLRAYHVWGEDCVQHLLGDFAFGIWDRPQRRLFCARDHLGVKPFYYAHIGSLVLFSNTLDCIRQHPAVSNTLNDRAIADFLLFEMNQDSATTSFADIQRLPPAHCAVWSLEGLRIRRYWTMPIEEPLLYQRSQDYFDQFKELLQEAVGDRVRTNRVGIFLSGGLDSSTLLAGANDLRKQSRDAFELVAVTKVDPEFADDGTYAKLVAKHLQIPVHFLNWGEEAVNPNWERTPFHTQEPDSSPWTAEAYHCSWRQIQSHSRVFFYGEGPDNALRFEWRPYASYLIHNRRYGRLLRDACSTLMAQPRPPYWGRISNALIQFGSNESFEPTAFPAWLSPDLEKRLDLRDRWHNLWREAPSRGGMTHPFHPVAYASFESPLWQVIFEGQDAGRTGVCTELRYPFVDVRLLSFLLRVPAMPWCRSKYFMRRAFRGALPRQVLRRQKSGIPCQAIMDRVARGGLAPFVAAPELSCYVNPDLVPNVINKDIWVFGGGLLARSLNFWLQNSQSFMQNGAGRD